MLKNYLKISLRNLRQQPGYSLINVGGLGLGLACCFLIVLFVQHELSFDGFHTKADRIFRLLPAVGSGQWQASSGAGFAVDLPTQYPEIEAAVRIENHRRPLVKVDGERRDVGLLALADSNLFQVFDFKLLRGDPATVLADPHAVVLSETTARTLFGDEDPVGRTLEGVLPFYGGYDLTVRGIMEDLPTNSHLQFDYVASFNAYDETRSRDYEDFNYFTFLLLKPGANAAQLEAKLPRFIREKWGPDIKMKLRLQPLRDIHFTTDILYDVDTNRDVRYVYAFSVIGLLILLIACINFMNLATARASNRAQEIGVRKVVGAARRQLVGQFIGESVFLCVLSLALAFGLVKFLLPTFNEILGTGIRFHGEDLGTFGLLIGIGLMTGLLAGIYPALYLSAFKPVMVLKGAVTRRVGGIPLRKGLIVAQFAISIFLIMSTLTVLDQLDYMHQQDLGFDREQVIFTSYVQPLRGDTYEAFRQELLKNPHVLGVARAGGLPGRVSIARSFRWPGALAQSDELHKTFWYIPADPGYVETLGLELVAGRDFSENREGDWRDSYILNEAAVKNVGWSVEEAVGHPFRVNDREMGTVIGVVKDFHFQSLHQQIDPVVLNMIPWFSHIVIRMAPGAVPQTLASIQETWHTFAPEYALDYTFLEEDFDRLYKTDEQLMQRVSFFAAVAILIASLGLFGLVAYSAEQRTKEIGIRKVMGATVPGLVTLLLKDFLVLVVLAFVVAAPLAYAVAHRWLEGFAYRITLGPGLFVLAGGLTLAVALLTVSYQTIRAALSAPVTSLRYE